MNYEKGQWVVGKSAFSDRVYIGQVRWQFDTNVYIDINDGAFILLEWSTVRPVTNEQIQAITNLNCDIQSNNEV